MLALVVFCASSSRSHGTHPAQGSACRRAAHVRITPLSHILWADRPQQRAGVVRGRGGIHLLLQSVGKKPQSARTASISPAGVRMNLSNAGHSACHGLGPWASIVLPTGLGPGPVGEVLCSRKRLHGAADPRVPSEQLALKPAASTPAGGAPVASSRWRNREPPGLRRSSERPPTVPSPAERRIRTHKSRNPLDFSPVPLDHQLQARKPGIGPSRAPARRAGFAPPAKLRAEVESGRSINNTKERVLPCRPSGRAISFGDTAKFGSGSRLLAQAVGGRPRQRFLGQQSLCVRSFLGRGF